MENIKGKIQSSVSNLAYKGDLIVSQTLSLKGKDISKKIFDNMIWVLVLVGVIILIYLSYLLTESFDIDKTIQLMNKEYKNINKVNVETPSVSGMEEKFDEIDVKKHTLCETFICSSAKSYLSGRQIFDYVSRQMFFQTIKFGARYTEIDLYENNDGNIVVSNGLFEGNWRLTLNEIFFEDFCRDIPNKVFNKEYTSNFNDPFIIYLGFNIKKEKMNLVADIIEQFMGKYLLSTSFSVEGGKNLLKLPLENLLGKIILITDGKIAKTNLTKQIHLRVGEKVRRLSYSQLLLEDREQLKEFNKHHLTIITPDPKISSQNYNSEIAFDSGCQIISMNFQTPSDHMKAYLSKFHEKSLLLKPFEFTKYADIPQKGYDPNRIAYYNNYEILQDKDEAGKTILEAENPADPEIKRGKKLDYNKDNDSIFFKNKLGAPVKPDNREGCCKLFIDRKDLEEAYPKIRKIKQTDGTEIEMDELDVSINNMMYKLSELDEEPDDLIKQLDNTVNKEEVEDIAQLVNYGAPAESKQDIKYEMLINQLGKILQKKREEMFKSGMEDPCFKETDTQKCNSKPLCYLNKFEEEMVDGKKQIKQVKCESQLSSIPYPKLCVPKYISPNRNMCLSSEKDKGFIDSKGIRQIFHDKMNADGFQGKWNSYLGPIIIADDINNQCEFTFKTGHDNKEFTMFLVNHDGSYFNMDEAGNDNFIGINNTYKLRAKGTFVDPMLRRVEKENGFPELPYHGYVEMKMDDYTDKVKTGDILRQCANNKFIGIYRYSDEVYLSYEDEETATTLDDTTGADTGSGTGTGTGADTVADTEADTEADTGADTGSEENPDNLKESIIIKKAYTKMIKNYYDGQYVDTGIILGYDKPLNDDSKKSPNIYCYKILSNECLDGSLGPAISFEDETSLPPGLYAPVEETLSNEELVVLAGKLGLEFKKEEFENNPSLKRRIINMVDAEYPELILEHKRETREEEARIEAEKEKARKLKEEEEKKKIAKKAGIFIYHNSSEASGTIKKPGDTFRIMGPNNVPFCIQRKIADFKITECVGEKCDSSKAYIGACEGSFKGTVPEPFCDNINAAHNIQFVKDGSKDDDRVQTIRFLNQGDKDNPIDACLSYNDKGEVLYSNCNLSKNKDSSINNKWKVYKLKGDQKYKFTSLDGKCLTRSPFNGKKPEELEDGLYQREAVTEALFASTKLEECSDKNKNNQEFDIKYMGDVQNCGYMDLEIPDFSKKTGEVRDTVYLGKKNFMMKDD